MVQTNHNKVETAEGHTALLRAVKSRLLPMVSSKTFPTISRYAAVSVILHSVHDSGYATCWSWRRCWCHWWRWQQFPAHCHKVNRIGTVALHCSNFLSKTSAFTLIWSGLHRAGSRRMVEALLLRKPANHHLLYRLQLQPIKSIIMGHRSEPTASGRLPARWTWPTSSRSSGVALTSSSPMIGIRTISTAPS